MYWLIDWLIDWLIKGVDHPCSCRSATEIYTSDDRVCISHHREYWTDCRCKTLLYFVRCWRHSCGAEFISALDGYLDTVCWICSWLFRTRTTVLPHACGIHFFYYHYISLGASCGAGAPLFPLVHLFPLLLFPFFHWLDLFSFFVHPFPFYQNSPTPFPGWRS